MDLQDSQNEPPEAQEHPTRQTCARHGRRPEPEISVALETVPRLAGFGGFGATNPSVAGAFKIRTWGHVFTITVSSNRTFTPAQYAVNTEPGLALGFNIYRRMR